MVRRVLAAPCSSTHCVQPCDRRLPLLKNEADRTQKVVSMIVLGRHRPLVDDPWNETAVRAAIDEIAADAVAHFDPDTFWPGHPSDDGVGDGNPSFYFGA